VHFESEGLDRVTPGLSWESAAMSELRTVRKHSNRRLWYPDESRYVTLADIYEWVIDGTDLNVIHIDTNADVTRDVLFQVMAAQEQTAAPAMTLEFLLQAIRTGARASGGMEATFLEQSMNLFRTLQGDRKKDGRAAQDSLVRTAQHFAEVNYQRWHIVEGRISRTLANAQSLYASPAVAGRSQLIAQPTMPAPTRSKRSPRPPAAKARPWTR
jgi:polyhydroxyalkanoate synthesis repressor PhaR